jgi:DNA primase
MSFDYKSIDVPELLRRLGIDARHDGDRWIASCPGGTHADHHPSWDMKDAKGTSRHALHSCFGCGFRGNATHLVSHVLGIQLRSAREWIEERCMGHAVPALRARMVISPLTVRRFSMPEEYVHGPLATWPAAPHDYASEDRGITAAQVERWRIGYALKGRLRGRIIFPVFDAHGRAVNYTARSYLSAGKAKKYLFPMRIEAPDMGSIWGEEFWPPQLELRSTLILTEGSINGLAVERVLPLIGGERIYVGAMNGSAVHLGQVMRIATFARTLILTDADRAGDNAAGKIEDAISRHAQFDRLRLPDKEDPQSIEHRDPKRLARLLQDALAKLGKAS